MKVPGAVRLLTLLAAGLSAGCTVPSLGELGEKQCDEAAGHPCIDGYACVNGVCRIPTGGECKAGETRACGSEKGECVAGTQACTDGAWGECAGAVGPVEEACDGKDNDCDEETDEGSPPGALTFYRDADQDSFGNPQDTTSACAAPQGSVANADDCDDARAAVKPGATETCNGVDDDCDDATDEGIPDAQKPEFFADVDQDQYGDPATAVRACSAPMGHAAQAGDCNDGDSAVHPGATETCNTVDDDCDEATDEGVLLTFYADQDADGAGRAMDTVLACSAPSGYAASPDDCDDTRAEVHPGAPEICDQLDNDCNVTVDDSQELPLVTTPTADSSLSWAFASQGVSAVYVDASLATPRVLFRRFDAALAPVGQPVDLSVPGSIQSASPALAALGADTVATWVDRPNATTTRLMLARLNSAGTLQFGAGRVAVAPSASVLGAPKVAVNDTGDRIAVAWLDANAQRVRAVVYDGLGMEQEPEQFVTPVGQQVFDFDISGIDGSGDFLFAANVIVGGSAWETSFFRREINLALKSSKSFLAVGATSEVALVKTPGGNGVTAAWVEQDGSQQYRLVQTASPLTGGGLTFVAGPTPDLLSGVSGAYLTSMTGGSVVWSWSQGQANATVFASGASGPVSVSGMGAFAPAALFIPGSGFAASYEADKGGGQGLDLYARLVCAL